MASKTGKTEQGQAVAESQASTAVAKAGSTALAGMELDPSTFLDDAQRDKAVFNPEDVAIPFLRVLQSNSPQCTMGDPKFNPAARPGMLINTVTGRLYDGQRGVVVVPIAFQRRYTEWWPRDNPQGKKGLVKDWGADDSRLKQTKRNANNKDITPEGTEVVASANYYVFVLGEEPSGEDFGPALLVLAGTQRKKANAWNALIQGLRVPRPDGQGSFTPAPYYMGYRVVTVPERNDKGSWMGVQITADGPVIGYPYGAGVYVAAKDYAQLVKAGAVKVQAEDETVVDAEVTPVTADGGNAF